MEYIHLFEKQNKSLLILFDYQFLSVGIDYNITAYLQFLRLVLALLIEWEVDSMDDIVLAVVLISILNGGCVTSTLIVPTLSYRQGDCGPELLSDARDIAKLVLNISSNYTLPPLTDNSNNTRSIQVSEVFGNSRGSPWDDGILTYSPRIIGIQSLTVSYGDTINSIQVDYLLADGGVYSSPRRGSVAGSEVTITLAGDEHIARVEGTTDSAALIQLSFITKSRNGSERAMGPYGGGTGARSLNVSGYILGFRGYASSHIDGLSVYYLAPLIKSELTYGGSGRMYAYDDHVDTIIPPVVGIENITIQSGSLIDGIRCTYRLLGGSTFTGSFIGNNAGGGKSVINLDEREILSRLILKTYGTYLDRLEVYVNQTQTNSVIAGPLRYGLGGFTTFEISGVILGIYGYGQNYRQFSPPSLAPVCSSIGVYTL